MARTVLRDPRFDREFLALPEPVRDACWHIIAALRRRAFSPGAGFRVEKLRRIAPTEAWTAHFSGDQYRLLYVVDGETLILFGVGARPGFYRRLVQIRGRKQRRV
jgi:mRNA-degrading endonuclease RelE of RelBE toxin-antitoxin system